MNDAHEPSRQRGERQDIFVRRVTSQASRDFAAQGARTSPAWAEALWLISVTREVTMGGNTEVNRTMRTHVISPRISALRSLLLLLSLCVLLAACGQTTTSTGSNTPAPTATAVMLDAYGTPITIPKSAPQKIVSLAPSTSEILGALNLQSKVVGVDFYTNYPADLAKVKKISDANGTFNIEAIIALKPDLVLSSGGLTQKSDAQLVSVGLNVVDLPRANYVQVQDQIKLVGRLTYTEDAANKLAKQIQQQTNEIKTAVTGTSAPSVLLEVDDTTPGKPYVFGGGTFGDELLQYANATNIFHDNTSNGGYPQVTDEAIISANP
ncbi:MAG: ABC transporter substrate-binding protein, partial [Ktedonobacteraceae bacterium]|nr:ABC transporter substrate-binding protein [Ktedonobacteraceae bacterium]